MNSLGNSVFYIDFTELFLKNLGKWLGSIAPHLFKNSGDPWSVFHETELPILFQK